jgi:predicted TIM-barrel fold metal-dependent hydrolase
MQDWVPDETIRNRILVQNPNKLYGFQRFGFAANPRR